jgi:predicted homoserine dehydrogenase-like protein
MHSEVVCIAKRDIAPGATLDGIGGPDWYGLLMAAAESRATKAVPIGIGAGAIVQRPIRTGQTITEDDVAVDETTFVARLRRLQDALYG